MRADFFNDTETRMQPNTWQADHTEMQREDHREWLQVLAISMVVIAAGVLLAYLVQ